jgi:hypothetical protein
MLPDNSRPVTAGPIPADRLRTDIPTFCELILKEDDPTMAVGIDFWPATLNDLLLGEPCLPGDERIDYDLGDLFGQEAVWFIRHRHGPALLAAILMWMGYRLHNEQRCPGLLEHGFLDRIKSDCPDGVDWVVMEHFRHHPEQRN